MRYYVCLLACCLACTALVRAQIPAVVPGHAHNDYVINQPLTDALAQGMMSVEADVHAINGELYVAHDTPEDITQLKTLRELYLEPLAAIVKKQPQLYPGYRGPFFLMIDFKTAGPETWQILRQQLQEYQFMLDGNPITVVLSGNRPLDILLQEKKALATIDGRPAELGRGYSTALMPVVSENLAVVLQREEVKTLSHQDRATISALAELVHAEGKLLRLWAIPDQQDAWKTLLEAGVDIINTDHIRDFSQFYRNYQQRP